MKFVKLCIALFLLVSFSCKKAIDLENLSINELEHVKESDMPLAIKNLFNGHVLNGKLDIAEAIPKEVRSVEIDLFVDSLILDEIKAYQSNSSLLNSLFTLSSYDRSGNIEDDRLSTFTKHTLSLIDIEELSCDELSRIHGIISSQKRSKYNNPLIKYNSSLLEAYPKCPEYAADILLLDWEGRIDRDYLIQLLISEKIESDILIRNITENKDRLISEGVHDEVIKSLSKRVVVDSTLSYSDAYQFLKIPLVLDSIEAKAVFTRYIGDQKEKTDIKNISKLIDFYPNIDLLKYMRNSTSSLSSDALLELSSDIHLKKIGVNESFFESFLAKKEWDKNSKVENDLLGLVSNADRYSYLKKYYVSADSSHTFQTSIDLLGQAYSENDSLFVLMAKRVVSDISTTQAWLEVQKVTKVLWNERDKKRKIIENNLATPLSKNIPFTDDKEVWDYLTDTSGKKSQVPLLRLSAEKWFIGNLNLVIRDNINKGLLQIRDSLHFDYLDAWLQVDSLDFNDHGEIIEIAFEKEKSGQSWFMSNLESLKLDISLFDTYVKNEVKHSKNYSLILERIIEQAMNDKNLESLAISLEHIHEEDKVLHNRVVTYIFENIKYIPVKLLTQLYESHDNSLKKNLLVEIFYMAHLSPNVTTADEINFVLEKTTSDSLRDALVIKLKDN